MGKSPSLITVKIRMVSSANKPNFAMKGKNTRHNACGKKTN